MRHICFLITSLFQYVNQIKNKLLNNTIAKVSCCLTPAQLYELRKTLEQKLSGYEAGVAPYPKGHTKQANEELLGSFISAKRI